MPVPCCLHSQHVPHPLCICVTVPLSPAPTPTLPRFTSYHGDWLGLFAPRTPHTLPPPPPFSLRFIAPATFPPFPHARPMGWFGHAPFPLLPIYYHPSLCLPSCPLPLRFSAQNSGLPATLTTPFSPPHLDGTCWARRALVLCPSVHVVWVRWNVSGFGTVCSAGLVPSCCLHPHLCLGALCLTPGLGQVWVPCLAAFAQVPVPTCLPLICCLHCCCCFHSHTPAFHTYDEMTLRLDQDYYGLMCGLECLKCGLKCVVCLKSL